MPRFKSDQKFSIPFCVNIAFDVALRVIDELMDIFLVEAGIRREFVSEQFRAARHVRLDVILQRFILAVLYMCNVNLAGFAIKQADDKFLPYAPGAFDFLGFLVRVHVARESADESLVGFDRAASAHLLETAALHRKPESMQHEPGCPLSDFQVAGDFIAADSVLAVIDQPHRYEPLVERDRTVFKDRTYFDGKLPLRVIVLALPETAGFQERNLFASACRASYAVRPANCDEQAQRTVGMGKIPDSFKQGLWPLCFAHALNFGSVRFWT